MKGAWWWLAAVLVPLLAQAGPTEDMKALLESGKPAEAYQAGLAASEHLGEPAFDFYFGVAAVDAGHPGEGVLALERSVLATPERLDIRLELARAYFVAGDDLRAGEEFDTVLRANPPPAVRANIARFTDALRERSARYKDQITGWVEVGYGYDSNVNAAPGGDTINLAGFGNVLLGSKSVKQSAGFAHLAGGAGLSHPVSPGWTLFGTATGDAKLNEAYHSTDQSNAALAAGVAHTREADLYRLTASFSQLWVDDQRFRTSGGVTGEWQRALDGRSSISAYAQWAQLIYRDLTINDQAAINSPRDSALYTAGFTWRRLLWGGWEPTVRAGANIGQEANRSGIDGFSRTLLGAQTGLSLIPRPRWQANLGLVYQNSRYHAADPATAGLTTRNDDYYGWDVSLAYAWSKNTSVRFELAGLRNSSNISLYDYGRLVGAVKLRYEFK